VEDIKLVRQLIDRDNRAWTTFVRRFEPLIKRRIAQVFYRYSYRASTSDSQDAFDYVMDHLMFDKTLSNFKKNQSLDGFVLRVTTNAVIDWHRKRVSARNMYGLRSSEVLQLARSECAVESTNVPDDEQSNAGPTHLFADIRWTTEEHLVLLVMSARTVIIDETALQSISDLANSSTATINRKIEDLRVRLHERWSSNRDIYDEMGLLWMRCLILERRGDSDRAQKRKSHLDKRIAEYQSKGIEPYPTRKEVAEIFNWDINKVDRIRRRIENKLREYIDHNAKLKTKLSQIA